MFLKRRRIQLCAQHQNIVPAGHLHLCSHRLDGGSARDRHLMNFLHVTVITVRLTRLLRVMQIHAFPGNRSCRRIPIHRRFRYPCCLIRSVRQHRLKLLCRLFAHGTFRQFGKRFSFRLLIIHIPAHTAFKYHCHTLLLFIFRFLLPTFRTKIEHLKIIIQNIPAKLC